jgi:exosortase
LAICVLILLCTYLIYRLGTLWHSNDDYGFGWFVPLLCLCLFWERWKRRPSRSPIRPASGTFLLLGGLGLALLPAALFLEVIPYWRFAGWIFASAAIGLMLVILYFLGGRNWSRHFAFPVLFFLIAVPWPTRLERPLIDKMSRLNAAVSAASANSLGTPAVRRGVLIETAAGLVGVDDACSGIRSLQASIMVALFLGELFQYSFLRRAALLFSAIALAFSCNVVRTTYLVRTTDLHGLAAVNLRHDQAGFIILGITLAGLLVLVWLLRPKSQKHSAKLSPEESLCDTMQNPKIQNLPKAPGDGAGQFVDDHLPLHAGTPHPATASFIRIALAGLVIWIILVEFGIQFWFRPAEKQAATLAAWSLKLPVQGAEFRESPISENIRAMLNYDEGRKAEWRDAAGAPWQIYYFRWLPAETRYRAAVACGQARGHAPDVCLRAAGMVLQTNLGTQTVSMNGARLRIGTERFLDRGRTFHVFSGYWEPNEWVPQGAPTTSSAITAVLHALRAHDRGRNEKRVIKLGVWGKETDEAAQAAFSEYLLTMVSK